jgi:alpha-beta hydrolase superfamily lysophospholipase
VIETVANDAQTVETEPGIQIAVRRVPLESAGAPKRVLCVVSMTNSDSPDNQWLDAIRQPGDEVYLCEVRGVGQSRWTRKNPPNYVERCLPLLGSTVDSGRVRDAAATALLLQARHEARVPVHVVGRGPGGIIAAYAALFEPRISGAIVIEPPSTHMDAQAPQFLNVLRVCDISDVLGMLAPRPLNLRQGQSELIDKVRQIYRSAGTEAKLHVSR